MLLTQQPSRLKQVSADLGECLLGDVGIQVGHSRHERQVVGEQHRIFVAFLDHTTQEVEHGGLAVEASGLE